MNRPARLAKSLVFATTLFLIAQFALISLIALGDRIPLRRLASFYPVSVAVHGVLLALVLVRKNDFEIVDTGVRLDRVNISNLLSMSRISTTPTILYLLLLSPRYPLVVPIIVLVILAFVSDFLDGRISRRLGEVTKIGMYLDSMSDYAILIAVSIAFVYFHMISLWFFVIVMVRLGFQFVGMAVLLAWRGRVKTGSNLIGKASIFATMVVYVAATLGLITRIHSVAIHVTFGLEIACSVILAVSLFEKTVQFYRQLFTAEKASAEKASGGKASGGKVPGQGASGTGSDVDTGAQ